MIDEVVMHRGEHVTLGREPGYTLIGDFGDLPDGFRLFERRGTGYSLRLTDSMVGRVAMQKSILDLAAVRASALFDEGVYDVPLPQDVRGKLVIGTSTILFQLVDAEELSEATQTAPAPPTASTPKILQPPMPYGGSEDFVFTSYSRSDFPTITESLVSINGWGYRIWYDKDIPGGADWLQLIRERVIRCRLVLVFLSPAAIASKWVQREVTFADGKEKRIVAVRLGPGDLGWAEMLLGANQMLDMSSREFLTELKRAVEHAYASS